METAQSQTPAQIKPDGNGAEPDTEPDQDDYQGDDDQTVWRRGLMCRAETAIADAAYEDWSAFQVDQEIIDTVSDAAKAWTDLGKYLKRLTSSARSTPAIEPTLSTDGYPDIPEFLKREPVSHRANDRRRLGPRVEDENGPTAQGH
jgi:hypothetical protein